jgi:hypothetical protein
MIRKALAAAVTLAISGNVMAFSPTTTPDYEVNFSGATATTKTLKQVVVENICDTTQTIDVYELNASSKNWAVACVTSTSVTSTADSVLFRKADLGSGYGVVHVDQSEDVAVLDPSTCEATSSGTDTVGTTTVNTWQCTGKTDVTPDIGTSDVEPAMFKGTLAPLVGGVATDFTNDSNMVIKPLSGLMFGVNATTDLRNALQAAQGLSVGEEDEANMPSLSSQAIRALFTGKVKTWEEVITSDGDDLLTATTDWNNDPANASHPENPIFVPPVSSTASPTRPHAVHICRRAQGSGTHAQIGALVLRTNCSGGVAMKSQTSSNNASPQVSAAQGSGDMTTCLDNLGTGSSNPYDSDHQYLMGLDESTPNAANRRWGLGYQSLEKNDSLSAAYRFVKIDGVAPTLPNVHAGKYYDFAESTLQRRGGDGSYNSTVTTAGKSTDVTAMFDTIATQLGQATHLPDINSGGKFDHPFMHIDYRGGWLASPNVSGNTVSTDGLLDMSQPVNPFGHYDTGANTCQPPILKFGKKIIVN